MKMDLLEVLARFFLRATVVLLVLVVVIGGFSLLTADDQESWGGVEFWKQAVYVTLYLAIALGISLFGTGVTRFVLRHRWVDEQYDREQFRNELVRRHIITDYTPVRNGKQAAPDRSRHLNRAS
jgi:hypothetical protein